MDLVLGLDGYKHQWISVALRDGAFERVCVFRTIAEALAAESDAVVVGVDVPIGASDGCGRPADHQAREFVGARQSSVFLTFPAAVLACASHKAAAALARQLTGKALSYQSYCLRDKIAEAELAARNDERVVEVHPEVSFRALAGKDLAFTKKSWNGQEERRRLLRSAAIRIPEVLQGPAGKAPVDDVLDAAVAAWSARRVAQGQARTLPVGVSPPSGKRTTGVIWY
jgi:predicted RNase H-like nuclease